MSVTIKIILIIHCIAVATELHASDVTDTTVQRMNHIVDVFCDNYGGADYRPLLSDSMYVRAIKWGKNNVPRSLANMAVVYAYVARRDRDSVMLRNAIHLLAAVISKYRTWTGTTLPPEEPFNLAPTTAYSLGLAAWMVWDSTPSSLRDSIRMILVSECDYQLLRKPASGYQKDTKAEENAVVPGMLVLTSKLFSDEPHASQWEEQAKCFAYHSITTSRDTAYCGLRTITAYASFDMDNHDFGPHPLYMAAPLVHFADAALAYRAKGRDVPWEFTHNVLPLWGRLKKYLTTTFAWSGRNSWEPTGLSREVSGATYMAVILGVDPELEGKLLEEKINHQNDFVEKKVGKVASISTFSYDWFNNCLVAQRYVVSILLHRPSFLPNLPLTSAE